MVVATAQSVANVEQPKVLSPEALRQYHIASTDDKLKATKSEIRKNFYDRHDARLEATELAEQFNLVANADVQACDSPPHAGPDAQSLTAVPQMIVRLVVTHALKDAMAGD